MQRDDYDNTYEDKHATKPARPPSFTDILTSVDSSESSLRENKPLMIHIIEHDTTLIIQPKPEITLGRRALLGANNRKVDVDFAPFDGFDKGVSQIHASIQREFDSVYLIDQQSSNSTILNGIQLTPNKRYLIHNGDIAYFGRLPIRFDF